MAINPFVELFRNPVGTLAWLGYFLGMLVVVVLAGPWAVRKLAWLIDRYYQNRMSDDWWSFGDTRKGYLPPAGWLLSLASVIGVLAIASWALGTVVWMLGV